VPELEFAESELDLEPEAPPPPTPRAPARTPAAAPRPAPLARPAPARPTPPRPSRIQPRPAAARPTPPALAPKRGLVSKPTAAAPLARGVPPELQRALDEVEQYVSLGFVDDAKDAVADLGARFPDHPAVAAKMAELGLEGPAEVPKPGPRAPVPVPPRMRPSPAPAPPPPAAEEEEEEEADDELSDLVGDVPEMPEPEAEPLAAEAPADDPFGELGLEEPAPLGREDNPFADEPVAEPEPKAEEPSLDLGFGEPESEIDAPSLGEPSSDGGGLDLGAELDGLFETQAAVPEAEEGTGSTDLGDAGLADIFKEFKKGVDKQLGKEDYDTRYNLGIAYKEMGLVDEAIAEFQLAAKDEGRLLECSSMLGICFLEKGMAKLAVKWFEKGLTAPGRTDEEYQGLRYDLATALETAGETDRALQIFTDLYGQDSTFRDVATRVRELRAALL
jgi:tetratricopeptide (TPR) repeat protein